MADPTVAAGTGSDDVNEILAAVLSFIIPGIGQIYNGQTTRGAAFLGGLVVFWIFTFIMMFLLVGFLMMFFAPLIHIAAAADAYIQAGKINSGEITV
ncbi:hypothetical protein [Natronobeatus ordinarius]|uniref:hypothetical protein n=1 Tax=Natronobeatus ordinarius TaxID=2963433 RepID=UPI0020CF4F96|nr:hypothetical protein [Natronobeatus ordinarius]